MTAALEEILKAADDAARALTTVGETNKDLSEEMTALAYTLRSPNSSGNLDSCHLLSPH